MRSIDSFHQGSAHSRPKAARITVGLPRSHHALEDILSRPQVRKVLKFLTRRGPDGKCRFERLCENYDNPALSGWDKLRWALPAMAITAGLNKAHLDRETMKRQLFHHPPTVRALALTAKSIATHGLTVPQRYTAPLFVVWNITQACNLSCRHCYQNARPKPLENELTTAEKLDVVDQLADEYVPFLALAGGEPLVCRDLYSILARCRERGIHVTLATNGTLLTAERCARLKEAGVKYVEVSLDSVNPHEHDRFRGLEGAWARTVQGIRNSVAAGIRTGMAVCFTRETAHTLDDCIRLAENLGCHTFSHFNFIPVGRGRDILDRDLTPSQRELLLERLTHHLQHSKLTVISTSPAFGRACIVYGPEEGLFATGHAGRGQGKKTMVLSRYIGGCGSGRCYCAIQPNGAVTPCVYISDIEVGNLRHRRFTEIWNNPLFDTLCDRDDRGGHCGVCDYRHYCGGCRARAYAYTGDIAAGDPGCIYNTNLWEELERRHPGLTADRELVQVMEEASR